jgi:putative endonuclease
MSFFEFTPDGEVPEWLNGAVSKTVVLFEYRGFESHPLRLNKMYCAYILKNDKDKQHYYGAAANVQIRLKSHNFGKVRSTKHRPPLKLIYFETFPTKTEALKREKFFKSKAGYAWLKNNNII